jgi:hypothetical protein
MKMNDESYERIVQKKSWCKPQFKIDNICVKR